MTPLPRRERRRTPRCPDVHRGVRCRKPAGHSDVIGKRTHAAGGLTWCFRNLPTDAAWVARALAGELPAMVSGGVAL